MTTDPITGADAQAIRERALLLPPPLLAALIEVALPLLEGKEPHQYLQMAHLRLGAEDFSLSLWAAVGCWDRCHHRDPAGR